MQSLFLLMLKLSHLVTGNFFNLESKPCCCDPRSLQRFVFVHLFSVFSQDRTLPHLTRFLSQTWNQPFFQRPGSLSGKRYLEITMYPGHVTPRIHTHKPRPFGGHHLSCQSALRKHPPSWALVSLQKPDPELLRFREESFCLVSSRGQARKILLQQQIILWDRN